MDSSTSIPASASSRAISIPLHSNSANNTRRLSNHGPRRRAAQIRRALNAERADSETGDASSSSLGSEWSSSPPSVTQLSEQHEVRLQPPVASPPDQILQLSTPPSSCSRKDKQRANSSETSPPTTLPPLFSNPQSPLGPSMISSSAYKSVNLNTHQDPESKEPARLITYTKHSQGFTWNDELFLPSYLLGRHRYRGHGGRAQRRTWNGNEDDDELGEFDEEGERCPVTDIFVTDEEAAAMMP